jgi:hypothetical protein
VALKELNYMNPYTGTHKAGNHAFRRFGTRTCGTARSAPKAYTSTGWVMRGAT